MNSRGTQGREHGGDGSSNPNLPFRTTGRGASENARNRFERSYIAYEPSDDAASPWAVEEERPLLRTEFLKDHASSVISHNNSPDLGFDYSLNPYRGCEHGCAYCYARPYHEFLGFSAGLDFEARIMVKEDAPELLREHLLKPSWQPALLALSGVTDCYQPIERKLGLTRRCLEVLREFGNPVAIVTKNKLVTRDVDILGDMARSGLACVTLSVTTLDAGLARRMEPRTSPPEQRLNAVRMLAEAGVPVCVNIAPIIPGLNDHEIPAILEAAAGAGAWSAGWGMLRLPHGVKDIFLDWLDREHPGKKARILARVREVRGGNLNDSAFGRRMTGTGIFTEQIRALFHAAARRHGVDRSLPKLSLTEFRRPGPAQMEFAGLV